MVHYLHYELLSAFKQEFYKGMLTENDVEQEIHIKKMSLPDGGVDENANFWGLQLKKDGKKYLLADSDENGNKRDFHNLFPIKVTATEKVAGTGGEVFYQIVSFKSFRIRPEQTMTFRELLNSFASLKHTNPKHQVLFWAMAITQMFDRANFRIATNPGFGKDSTVDIIGNLIGGCGTIVNPTIAKLEERSSVLKWLAVNEVVGVAPADWRHIELFLLDTGAHKPLVTKRSKAHGKVGEEIDISHFSLSLLYNDINNYRPKDKYFDTFAKDAVGDRFVPVRLNGRLNEDFNAIAHVVPAEHAMEQKEKYLNLIRNFLYYKENYRYFTHNYDMTKVRHLPERWRMNVEKLFIMFDIYSHTQEEFDGWVAVVNGAIQDYEDMLHWFPLLEKLEKKVGKKNIDSHKLQLLKMQTFTERRKYIEGVMEGKQKVTDVKVWEKYEEEIL